MNINRKINGMWAELVAHEDSVILEFELFEADGSKPGKKAKKAKIDSIKDIVAELKTRSPYNFEIVEQNSDHRLQVKITGSGPSQPLSQIYESIEKLLERYKNPEPDTVLNWEALKLAYEKAKPDNSSLWTYSDDSVKVPLEFSDSGIYAKFDVLAFRIELMPLGITPRYDHAVALILIPKSSHAEYMIDLVTNDFAKRISSKSLEGIDEDGRDVNHSVSMVKVQNTHIPFLAGREKKVGFIAFESDSKFYLEELINEFEKDLALSVKKRQWLTATGWRNLLLDLPPGDAASRMIRVITDSIEEGRKTGAISIGDPQEFKKMLADLESSLRKMQKEKGVMGK